MKRLLPASLGIAAVTLGAIVFAGSQEPAKQKFIRLGRTNGQITSLETSVTQYQSTKPELAGVTVDLIGAVHVGERSYYEELNSTFNNYDAVLYEFVAPESHKIPNPKAGNDSMVSQLQRGLKAALNLEFQLDLVDYKKSNFVHADMSPAQFAESMKKRGESIWTMMLQMWKAGMSKQMAAKGPSDVEMLVALFKNDKGASMKRIMAEQFEDLESAMNAISGPNGSTIVTERNKVCLDVLSKQIKEGKAKRIAIFYGAGHYPDMHERLIKDFGMKPVGERWITAWNMPYDKPTKASDAKAKPAKAGASKDAPSKNKPAESKPEPAKPAEKPSASKPTTPRPIP